MRRSVLFISGFLPSVRVPSGGQQLVDRELRLLCKTEDVTLIAFQNEREAPVSLAGEFEHCRNAFIIPLTRSLRARAAARFPALPLITSARYAAAAKRVKELVSRQIFHEVRCEFVQAASLLQLIPAGIPKTLVVHDFFHQALARRAALSRGPLRLLLTLEAARTKRWEIEVLKSADRLVTLTEKDRETACLLTGRHDVAVRYPTLATTPAVPTRGHPSTRTGNIVFIGQMSRRENEDAAVWFIDSIWPEVVRACPHAHLTIAGADPGPRVCQRQDARVSVTGYVDDISDLLGSATICIAPLRMGSGIKIKVVQSLEAGVPTVATPVGAEGVRPSPLLHVADSVDEFASTCIRLLK